MSSMRRPSVTGSKGTQPIGKGSPSCPAKGNSYSTTSRTSVSNATAAKASASKPTAAQTSASKATAVKLREKEILDTLAKQKTAKEQLEAAKRQKLEEEAEAVEDEDEEEEEEDEYEDDSSGDDEEDGYDEDDEEEEDEEKLQVKLQKIGDVHSKIVDLPASATYKEFLKMVAKKCSIDAIGQVVLTYVDNEGDTVVVEDKDSFRRTVKLNWPGENGNPAHHTLKLTVDTKDNLLASGSGIPRRPSTSFLRNTTNLLQQQDGSSSSNTGLDANTLASTMTAALNSTTTVHVKAGEELQWTKMNLLGKGSFGTVYEGITNDGKLLAVKQMEIPAEKAQDEDDGDVKSLTAEINLMSSLKHQHIVAYYGCQTRTTESGGKQFEIFLEHCHGGSLTSLRKKFDKVHGKLSISLARNYIKQILLGLEYLHQQGVVHRDIKSDNVLISATGDAKLADFGCSKKMSTAAMEAGGESGPNAALYQTMVGTPLFMAPEVMNDAGPGYGSPADIWSVGCLLLELLGRKPWIMQGTNMFQIMFQISQSKEMPSGVPSTCPADLRSFFEKIFDRDPAKRGTCEELLKHRWITVPEKDLVDVPLEAK